MTDPDTLEARVEAVVRRLVAPLEAEVQALRAEVAALTGEAAPVPAAPPPALTAPIPAPPAAPPLPAGLPVAGTVPPDRADFARMLARGLEAEAKTLEEEPGPEDDESVRRKRGWNPFKR